MKSKRTITLILVFLTSIGLFLRTYNLNSRGIFGYDEGQFVSEAKYTSSAIKWGLNYLNTMVVSKQRADDTQRLVWQFQPDGTNPRTARAFHTFILSLAFFSGGDQIYKGELLIAVFGILSILATFFLSLKMTGSSKVSLMSAAILVFMPYHLIYSRSLLSEVNAQLFFVIALIVYLAYFRTKKLYLYFLTGVLIGLAFVTNGDRVSFFCLPIIELILHPKRIIQSSIIFLGGFIIFPILMELPYYFAFLLTHNLGIVQTVPGYFEQQLWAHTRLLTFGYSKSLLSVVTYPYLLVLFGGIGLFFFLVLGFISICFKKQKFYLILLIPVIFTFLFQIVEGLQPLRALSPILPLLSIIAAVGLVEGSAKLKKDYKLAANVELLLILVVVVELIIRSLPLFSFRNTFNQVAGYLNQVNAQTVLTTSATTLVNLDSNLVVTPYQNNIDYMSLNYKSNQRYDYLVTTSMKFTFSTRGHSLSRKLDPTLQRVKDQCKPDKEIRQVWSPIMLEWFTFEHNTSLASSLDFIKKFDYSKDSDYFIYNLNNCPVKLTKD